MKFILLLVCFIPIAFAGDVGPESKFLVLPLEDGLDVESLKSKDVKVLPPHESEEYKTFLPDVTKRDSVFKDSNLSNAVESWDDFEKDSLFLKLSQSGSSPIDRVMKKHPELDRNSLENAQKIILQDE